MRIACSLAVFKEPLEKTLPIVKSWGFSTIDLICIPNWGQIEPSELIEDTDRKVEEIAATLERHGITPVSANFAVHDPHNRSTPEIVENRKKQMEALGKLFQRVGMRVAGFYPGYLANDRDWKDVLRDEVESIREMQEIAQRYGIEVGPEIHMHTPFQTIVQADRLLEAIPDLRICYDQSHFIMQGFAREETAHLMDRALHVHVRDAAKDQMQLPYGTGEFELAWVIDELKKRNYEGSVTIEYIPKMENPGQSITALREDLLRLI